MFQNLTGFGGLFVYLYLVMDVINFLRIRAEDESHKFPRLTQSLLGNSPNWPHCFCFKTLGDLPAAQQLAISPVTAR